MSQVGPDSAQLSTDSQVTSTSSKKELGLVAEKTNKLWILLFIATAAGGAVLIAYGAGQFSNPPPESLNDTIEIVKMTAGSAIVVGSAVSIYYIATRSNLKTNIRRQLLKKYSIEGDLVHSKVTKQPIFSKDTFETIIESILEWETTKKEAFNKTGEFIEIKDVRSQPIQGVHNFKGLIVQRKGNVYQIYDSKGQELGKGSFGAVLKVFNIAKGQFEAMKMAFTNKDAIEALQREHNLMREAGIEVGELLEGQNEESFHAFTQELGIGNLEDWMAIKERSLATVTEIIEQIINEVANLHKKNIFHQDIKPKNIIVFENNGKPSFKLRDFGFAEGLEENKISSSGTTSFAASTDIMSLEAGRFQHKDILKRDVFALGVTLCQIIAYDFPYSKGDKDIMDVGKGFRDKELRSAFMTEGISFIKAGAIVNLIKNMTNPIASARPSMAEVQRRWRAIKKPLDT